MTQLLSTFKFEKKRYSWHHFDLYTNTGALVHTEKDVFETGKKSLSKCIRSLNRWINIYRPVSKSAWSDGY